jgi:cellulose synthase/poly-beta-1,6-N-acetylglucosamine synthase-like glycosyltransferase
MMSRLLEAGFWLGVACVLYTYAGYPLLLALLARWRRRPTRAQGPTPRSVSIVVAAYNEERSVERRLCELTDLLDSTDVEGEVILVSDGSTDGTAPAARALSKGRVRVIELPTRSGKAVALNAGCAVAEGEVIVFADIRQTWEPDALHFLLESFADPQVGAVSGELVLHSADGVLAGVSLYWRYEKVLRLLESQTGSTVVVTGAISAVRRRLFRPIPPGTVSDDLYWPLRVALQGYRLVQDRRAIAYDRLPPRVRDEFRRKVRTLSGGVQFMFRLPAVLFPWGNPVWFQFVSHKALRLVVPWALLGVLAASAFLTAPLYRAALLAQVGLYGLGVLGLWPAVSARSRLASGAASFLVLNSAAWLAFWVWLSGRTEHSWHKVSYASPPKKLPAEAPPLERLQPNPLAPSLRG